MMCESPSPLDKLKRLWFGMESLVECCTKPHTCERELAQRAVWQMRDDLEKAIVGIEAELKRGEKR